MTNLSNIKTIILSWHKKVEKFLNSKQFKNFLTFLLFVLISFGFWCAQKLKENFETVYSIPIEYINKPDNYIFASQPPTSFKISVQDQGLTLLSYARLLFKPIQIDLKNRITAKGKVTFSSNEFDAIIRSYFQPTTRIVHTSPENIDLTCIKEESKEVTVQIDAEIECADQYCVNGKLSAFPQTVTAYGPKEALDTLLCATTILIEKVNLKDSISLTIPLQEVERIRFIPSQVDVKIPVTSYTENAIDCPIEILNLPSSLRLITFPSHVRLTYCVAINNYAKINLKDIRLAVDYKEIVRSDNGKVGKIEIQSIPQNIFNVRIDPEEVECLVEEDGNNAFTEDIYIAPL